MLYEYKCHSCGHIFEKSVRLADREVPINSPCPECNEMAVEQFIGGLTVIESHKLMTGRKPDGEFRERIAKIHERTPGSQLHKSCNFSF